jgi:hypothetical protein
MKTIKIGGKGRKEDTLELTMIEHKDRRSEYRKELMVEAYDAWAGDSETGFGITANLYLSEKEAIQLLDFLLQNFQPSSRS